MKGIQARKSEKMCFIESDVPRSIPAVSTAPGAELREKIIHEAIPRAMARLSN
jgi:hypothetical protein